MNSKLRFHFPSWNAAKDRPQKRTSLKQFLLSWVRIIIGGSMLLIVLGVLFFVYRTESRSWFDRQNEAVDSAAHTINLFLQDNYETLITISHMDINLLTLFPQILQENLRRSPALKEIVRLDETGKVLAMAFQDRPIIANLYTIPQSRWFEQARNGQKYLGDVQFTEDNQPYVILAVPTPSHGVVAARLEMKVLQDVVTKIHFGSTGQTYIIDSRGTIVADPDLNEVSRKIDLANMTVFQTIIAAPEKRWHGEFPNFLGYPVVGSSAAIADTDWVVITEISRHEANATTYQAIAILGSVLLLFGVLINLVATRLLQNAIINPIINLSTGAERIGMGQLDYQIGVMYNDEVGDVSRAFNQMTLSLADRELALKQARDEAINASQFKSRLLANVGHDLRTPINSILGYAEILNEGVYGELNQQEQKATSRILSSTRRLLNLVNSILDESQIEVGKLTLVNEPFNPREILHSIRDALEIPAQAKGIILQTECSSQLPTQIMGDVHRLQQIVWNLAENSLKFTQQGSVRVYLDQLDGDHWLITVSDTGVGIPMEAQSYIFEAFRQIDGSTTRENRGVGLGLSIVKQLTVLMGGSIQLQSQIGQGSVFTVLLPLVMPLGRSDDNQPNILEEEMHQ